MELVGLFGHRALILLLFGVLVMVGSAFVLSKVLKSFRHGFSMRLQLFLAIAFVTFLLVGLFGLLAFDRLQMRAAELMASEESTMGVLAQLLADFGPKLTFLAFVLGSAAAVAAFVLGRGTAAPLERLILAAEAIARGERQAVLPPPQGREVRRLTMAFESMRRSLEDRHTIERFVADLGHELKNPVAAIRAACEALSLGAVDDPTARARFVGRIDEAGRRLEILLHDLLGLARLEAQGVPLDTRALDLARTVTAAIEAAEPRATARNVVIDADEPTDPAPVRGDERWLRRAVDNLLSNAVRYAPEGTAVDVRLRVDGDFVVLTLRDRGPGVTPALRARLFERFVTDRTDADGTGLGLAIVRSVAEHHGGRVRLVEVSPGACFELRIPKA
ncbi:ATP-binding protein [Myxococcota bacterium]|nr:ATP-binding protein [Myxococcota bacterium]